MAEERGLPILGVCYGFQEMSHMLGGRVDKAPAREFGHADVRKLPLAADAAAAGDLFAGLPDAFQVWMSHGDKIHEVPPGFVCVGSTDDCEFAAAASVGRPNRLFGLQFHPEVAHTPRGKDILKNFVVGICHAPQDWTMASFVNGARAPFAHPRAPRPRSCAHSFSRSPLGSPSCRAEAIEGIRAAVGPTARVIGAVSGGVDSTVAAALMARAIGDRFHGIMVDNGLLRKDERVQVLKRLRDELGVNLRAVDASERFLTALAGVSDPERKRKIIGAEFIHVFQEEAAAMGADFQFLMQGTLFPDVIESVSFKGPSATIKSHHNVGGLLANMKLKLVEPLRELFKDEVRALGVEQLGLPRDVVFRHPFPGPGLAIRMLGEVTREAADVLRDADVIFLEELRAAGEYDKIGQAFCVLLPCKSVGVMGDSRTYEKVLALRAVATSDYMTADWYEMPYAVLKKVSTRIINEVRGINRVVYDVSSKPPATIEWE